ncbi:MAG: DNA-directed RNA polymerase subunit omega [Rickettsiales bacterium]|jgi:DNA-directed RNA polymerase subunit omega|nr:DNA-directed RNA polymerase subunit omega [Rickettsiales bacterium]
MARITISDVLPYVDNKYELGMLASQRVRDLNGGEAPVITVHPRDKATVTALREIASGQLNVDDLKREFIQSYKKMPVADEDAQTLESNAETPDLKELKALDEELSGAARIEEELDSSDGADAGEEVADEEAVEVETALPDEGADDGESDELDGEEPLSDDE